MGTPHPERSTTAPLFIEFFRLRDDVTGPTLGRFPWVQVTYTELRVMGLQIGMHAQTPFPPRGLVEVVAIEDFHPLVPRQTVLVRFVGHHPHGYPAGTLGRYFQDELQPVGHAAAES